MSTADLPADPLEVPDSLRALLTELVDYAGSFPPASLPLVTALEKHVAYLASPWSWMLARWVAPAGGMPEILAQLRRRKPPAPIRLALITSTAETPERSLDTLAAELEPLSGTGTELRDVLSVDQVEIRLPGSLLGTDVVRVRGFIQAVAERLEAAGLGGSTVFLEVPVDENLRQTLSVVTGAVRAFNRERDELEQGPFAVKVRTGGPDMSDVPADEQLAHVIVTCRDADVAYKATAGLHHPVRTSGSPAGRPEHGFLNLFMAAALADANDLNEAAVCRVLSADDSSRFRFEEESASWEHLSVDTAAIGRTRRRRARSFGSCSFAEPVADLRSLRYL